MTPAIANPTYDFKGQVALVTGASSGMGLAAGRAFAAHGASVTPADINEHALRGVADELTAAGQQVLAVPATSPTKARSPPWSSRPWRRSAGSTWRSTTP